MSWTYLQRAGLACAAALALGALSQSALAQPDDGMSAVRKACRADYRTHCSRLRPDSREAVTCLEQQIEKLSQKCQDALFAILPPPTRVTDAPGPADSQQNAAAPLPPQDTSPASSRAAAEPPPASSRAARAAAEPPAAARAAEEPPPPAAVRAAAEPPPLPHPSAAQRSALRQHCRKDYTKYCSGIPASSPDAIACLQGNLPGLSRACRRVVNATMPQERTPIVSAPPPSAVPARSAARRAEAAAEPPPPSARDERNERNDRSDYAPPPPPARADYAPPPPPNGDRADRDDRADVADRGGDAPPRRVERAVPPPPVETGALRAYCGRDFAAICPSLRPGSSEAVACLQRHADALMPRCRRAVSETLSEAPRGRARESVALAPEEPAAPPPPRQHRRRYAPAAGAVALGRACQADLYRHCRRVRPGHGRELACLAAHQRSLTFRCRSALRTTRR